MRTFTTLGLTVIIAAVVLSTPSTERLHAQSSQQLGIEIKTNLHDDPLYLPVGRRKKGKGALLATVPVRGAGGVTAVRIAPIMTGGQVKLEVYFIYEDYEKIKSCVDLQSLRHKLAGVYYLGLEDLKKVKDEADDNNELITIEAVSLRPILLPASYSQNPHPCGCGYCGKPPNELACCPNKGECIGCGHCGRVCCPPVGEGEGFEIEGDGNSL